MSVINNGLLLGAGADDYQISRSVRLRSSATGYFSRTLSTSSTSSTTCTWSGWVKRGALGAARATIAYHGNVGGTGNLFILEFVSDTLRADFNAALTTVIQTSAVYRDPSAWYHIVLAYDSTQATASNRAKLYVNGAQVTAFSTANYPALNQAFNAASTNVQNLGNVAGYVFDGYMTEVNFIDGQALTPSSFGETNAVTGVWKPKKYAGTYGTNGFYLNFSDNSGATATTIGKDYSGNGNNCTPNNISVTAGVTYDSMLDVPTLYADGGNGRGNYAVINSTGVGVGTIADSNLKLTATASAYQSRATTIGVTSGKWYWEVAIVSGGNYQILGIDSPSRSYASGAYVGDATSGRGWTNAANTYVGGAPTSYGATYTTNDVLGFALDMDAGTLICYKNGVSQGTAFSGITGEQAPAFSVYTSGVSIAPNFGQRPFTYTPPTGFVALNTQNLPTPTISNGANYMAATTYTANASTQTINNTVNGVSFQPDFVWTKSRTGAYSHLLYDVIRGVNTYLGTNNTTAESTGTALLTSFNSNGFTLGANENSNTSSGYAAVAWQWKAGGTAVSNTSGSITSSVSAGVSQGFSVVTYTGTGANATVGHGLGVAPSMVVFKKRNGISNWVVYHKSIGATAGIFLDLTSTPTTSSSYFNNTAPTSSVLSLGTAGAVNDTSSTTHVAYCFAEVAGFSKFGSYTGNGSAGGPFVFTGMRPRYIMVKRTDAIGDWYVFDTSRDPYNATTYGLIPNSSGADTSYTGWGDILSNGFKIRRTDAAWNASGGTYIYAAFAENPFKHSLAR